MSNVCTKQDSVTKTSTSYAGRAHALLAAIMLGRQAQSIDRNIGGFKSIGSLSQSKGKYGAMISVWCDNFQRNLNTVARLAFARHIQSAWQQNASVAPPAASELDRLVSFL